MGREIVHATSRDRDTKKALYPVSLVTLSKGTVNVANMLVCTHSLIILRVSRLLSPGRKLSGYFAALPFIEQFA